MIDPDAEDLRRALERVEIAWLQVECALFPSLDGEDAHVPWAELAEALDRWRAEARFDRFGFMRKPPGLRLRFAGPRLHERLMPALFAWLETMVARNAVRAFRPSTYEPETHRFGGKAGIDIAHLLFDRDSSLLLRQEALLAAAHEGMAPRDELSLAVVSDLVGRCVDDGAEAWDVWMRLRDALGDRMRSDPMSPPETDRRRAISALAPSWRDELGVPQRELLQQWQQAHSEVAAALCVADGLGMLQNRRRRWLASACVFHWNRAGFDVHAVHDAVSTLIEIWRPPEHRP